MNKKSAIGRSWWRGLFADHPGFANKDSEAFVESGSGMTKASKVYCKVCLSADTNLILETDIRAVNEGRITVVRSEAAIEDYCESIDHFEFDMGSIFTIALCSVEESTDEPWARRLHSLYHFNMYQSPQNVSKPTIDYTTTRTGRGRVSKEAAIFPI